MRTLGDCPQRYSLFALVILPEQSEEWHLLRQLLADRRVVARPEAGEVGGHAPYLMCASGWGEALTLLKMYVERGIAYGPVALP